MTDLKPGDRVRVEYEALLRSAGPDHAAVTYGDEETVLIAPLSALTKVVPVEPPVGSVVVKDGVAWIRCADAPGWHSTNPNDFARWSDLCDGKVIHIGGEA